MKLPEAFKALKESIVFFAPKYRPIFDKDAPPPNFPQIIGTGFVIDADGIIATNDHVVKEFSKLWKPPGAPEGEWPVFAFMWKMTAAGMLQIPLKIIGIYNLADFTPGKYYYGPIKPDISFVRVETRGLPVSTVDDETEIEEGMGIATAGYPMGSDALMAPGYPHQFTPILQSGVISAVLPFQCEKPHAFMINIMSRGGASGSPVFFPDTGKVVGVLCGSLVDHEISEDKDLFKVPVNISYVVPAHYLMRSMAELEKNPDKDSLADRPTLHEVIERAEIVNVIDDNVEDQIFEVKYEDRGRKLIKKIDPDELEQ